MPARVCLDYLSSLVSIPRCVVPRFYPLQPQRGLAPVTGTSKAGELGAYRVLAVAEGTVDQYPLELSRLGIAHSESPFWEIEALQASLKLPGGRPSSALMTRRDLGQ
jgi:hypothetical protein